MPPVQHLAWTAKSAKHWAKKRPKQWRQMGAPEMGSRVTEEHREEFARRGWICAELVDRGVWCDMPWSKHVYKRHNLPFWTHLETGESTWIRPSGAEV